MIVSFTSTTVLAAPDIRRRLPKIVRSAAAQPMIVEFSRS
jgi:hypothetical protein